MLNKIEIGAFLNFYNRNGYVLDFSTPSFDAFTMQSIGIPLCQKYEMSKGRSLSSYCNEADYDDVFKLLADLFQYYELNCLGQDGEDRYIVQYKKCKIIMDRELEETIRIDTPAIMCVNRDYIKSIASRANKDIDNEEFDSAITKARTLLEEVFCHVIEEKGEEPSAKGDISKLYNQVKTLYNMHQSRDVDRRINSLLSGLEKILSAIADMRNKGSDSHGVGNRRIVLEEHHTRLYINSAITMAEFILSVQKKNNKMDILI